MIIHRVWLGPNRPDPFLKKQAAAWARLNDADVWDWTDAGVERALLAGMVAPRLYEEAPTYVHRADVTIVEAVRQHGGVAVAWDAEPLRPLAEFYAREGLAPDDPWTTPDADDFPGGAFFGAPRGHAGLATLLGVLDRWQRLVGWRPPNEVTGPYGWAAAFTHGELLPVLGTRYDFYPTNPADRGWQDDGDRRAEALRRGSFAVHHARGSWLGEENRKRIRVR